MDWLVHRYVTCLIIILTCLQVYKYLCYLATLLPDNLFNGEVFYQDLRISILNISNIMFGMIQFRNIGLAIPGNCRSFVADFMCYFLVFRVSKDLYLVITQKLMPENRRFSHEKRQFSLGNLINQLIQDKSFSFIVCWGGGRLCLMIP